MFIEKWFTHNLFTGTWSILKFELTNLSNFRKQWNKQIFYSSWQNWHLLNVISLRQCWYLFWGIEPVLRLTCGIPCTRATDGEGSFERLGVGPLLSPTGGAPLLRMTKSKKQYKTVITVTLALVKENHRNSNTEVGN